VSEPEELILFKLLIDWWCVFRNQRRTRFVFSCRVWSSSLSVCCL